MLPAQDHKRLKDNDTGPNTGGMGAVCPYFIPEHDLDLVKREVFTKALRGMRAKDCPFVGSFVKIYSPNYRTSFTKFVTLSGCISGVLYAGLMLTDDGIKVLEFNCRFGDPETQVLMPLLRSDLFDIIEVTNSQFAHTDQTCGTN